VPWLALALVFLLGGSSADNAALESTGFAFLGMALALRWRRPCRLDAAA
jgi:hypothetical protein